jgi:hypothetical protein
MPHGHPILSDQWRIQGFGILPTSFHLCILFYYYHYYFFFAKKGGGSPATADEESSVSFQTRSQKWQVIPKGMMIS